MNIYFFSENSPEKCRHSCSYLSCPEKFVHSLQSTLEPKMQRLMQNDLLQPQMAAPLYNGDLLILHIEHQETITKLVENRDFFEHCKIILILNVDIYHNSKKYHQLNPRFITTSNQSPSDLKNVVYKLIDLMRNWGRKPLNNISPSLATT